jgi:ABC-type polysaccharide/polyol phosphate transport system ATPase subunit
VLSKGPAWLGREPLVAPALMALQEDESEIVREALLPAAAEEWVRQAPAPVAGGALPAEVAVLAEELALRAQAVQHERPADPDGPAEEICLADATFHVCAGRPLAVIDDDRGTGRRLLRVIAGLERSAGGRLEVRRRAALLSDIDDVFEPDLTVIENALLLSVYLGADVRTAAPVAGIAAEDAGLDGQLEAPLRELGAEQQARLAVAVAIECVSPQLLLIGRLPAIADGAFIARVRQRTAELAGSGAAVVQLVRDAGELLIPARSALWLHDGRIRSHGHAASVLATARAARAPVVAG